LPLQWREKSTLLLTRSSASRTLLKHTSIVRAARFVLYLNMEKRIRTSRPFGTEMLIRDCRAAERSSACLRGDHPTYDSISSSIGLRCLDICLRYAWRLWLHQGKANEMFTCRRTGLDRPHHACAQGSVSFTLTLDIVDCPGQYLHVCRFGTSCPPVQPIPKSSDKLPHHTH
jgi:hypothetical protein